MTRLSKGTIELRDGAKIMIKRGVLWDTPAFAVAHLSQGGER